MLMILLSILVPTALGLLLLGILLRDDAETGPQMRLALSFPVGMGLVTAQMFFLGLLRVPLGLLSVSLPPLAEIAVLALAAWKLRITVLPSRQVTTPSPTRSWTATALMLLLAGWSIAKLGSVFLEATLRPIYAWDAWANWSAGAKAFFYAHSLLLDSPPQDFFGKGVVSRIIEYPLHNALSQVWFALWMGHFDETLVKLGSPLAFLSLAGVIYQIGKREIGKLLALALLVMFLSSPLLSYHAVEAYADLLLGMYLFLALTALFLAMQGQRAYWPLVGLFSAFALFTKDEAPFFILPLMASSLIFLMQRRSGDQASWRRTAARMVLPLLLAAPWFLFKTVEGIGIGAGGIHVVLTFHPEVIGRMITQLLSLANFSVVPLFFIILLALAGKPSREFLHLAAPVACYVAFFASVYCFTTFYYEFFSNGTVFFRNVLTWYPSLLLLIVVLLKKSLPDDWRMGVGARPALNVSPKAPRKK